MVRPVAVWLDLPVTTPARNSLGVAIALAAIVALSFVPGGFFVVLLVGLVVAVLYARRWSVGDPSRRRRVAASLLIAAGVFVAGSIIWLIGVLASAYECELEEVQCSSWAEFLASHLAWGFVPIAGLSLATGWVVTSRRTR